MSLMSLAYIYAYNMYWTVAEDSSSSTAEATDAALAMTWKEAHYMDKDHDMDEDDMYTLFGF